MRNPNTTPIKVCYYRGSQQECDYYNQSPAHPTNFVFPLHGTVRFDRDMFLNNGQPSGLVTITLENPCDPDRARTRGVGLGLELLRKRLTNHYGAGDAVYAQEQEGHFRVELRIPAFAKASAFAEAPADETAGKPEASA